MEYALNEFVESCVGIPAKIRKMKLAVLDKYFLNFGPPICCPPGIYLDATATEQPRSIRRIKSSTFLGSSDPSDMVTTTIPVVAESIPYFMALAGPGP